MAIRARFVGRAAGVLALGVTISAGAAGPAFAGPKGTADVQWAQQVLKEKGFDPGKPTGEMTPKTHAALSAYQRSVGLPVTGALDGATTARLLSGKGPAATMGNLAAPSAAAHGGGTRDGAGHPTAPAPHAAPAARVEALGGPTGAAVISAVGASVAPAPRAVPSGSVTTAAPPPVLPGQAPPPPATAAEESGGVAAIEAPGWVRGLVVALIGGIFTGFGVLWWRSGRRSGGLEGAPSLSVASAERERREPGFGPGPGGSAAGGAGLRAERWR